jgi:hypothetical protein
VLLERPWHVSADGEQLAVVLATPANYPPDDVARPFVSHWGNDPTWGAPPVNALSPDQFPGSSLVDGVTLPELTALAGPGPVRVLAYDVKFDSGRRVWYADIQMNTADLVHDGGATYRPFVRLAVARFQQHSLPALSLSPAVTTDFAQLLPDRTVTVTTDSGDPNRLVVKVTGPIFAGGSWPGPPVDPKDVIEETGIDPSRTPSLPRAPGRRRRSSGRVRSLCRRTARPVTCGSSFASAST